MVAVGVNSMKKSSSALLNISSMGGKSSEHKLSHYVNI